MSTRVEQRAVIEYFTVGKMAPTEIHSRLKAVYGDDAIDRSTVNQWAITFRDCEPGKAIIVDENRSGRLITATDDKHRKFVDDLIQNDRRITQKRITNCIGISKERVAFIIEQLGYRKICARWVPVPRRLTDENKQRRLECCEQLLQRYRNEGDNFLLNIVTGDESWVLKGNHYTSDDEVKAAVKSWIREKSEECFSDGIKKLVTRWEKCVSLNGDYVEK